MKHQGGDFIKPLRKLLLPTKKFLSFLAAVALASFFLSPAVADAGFFSLFERLLGAEKENAASRQYNSRTVPLLDAPVNQNPYAGRGGAEINVVQQSALLAVTGPLGSIADVEEYRPAEQISIYVVREGDNLSQIAQMFRVSVNTILWANDIKRADPIRVGQTLVILPISGIRHTVQAGETLQSIASRYSGDVNEIMRYNGFYDKDTLALGQIVIIPNGEGVATVQTQGATATRARGTNGPQYASYYLRPISGGARSQGLHGYNGVDLADACGTPVMAAASGDVIVARTNGWNGGYGKYAVITHPNSTQTLYAHLNLLIVGEGWHVAQGQVVGYIGSTGNSTGCHVHFEVRGAQNPFVN